MAWLERKDRASWLAKGRAVIWRHRADAEKEAEAMNVLPKFEDVRKTAQTVEYKVLPVSCEILSDICTPIETMKILKNVSTHCYMLESAQADEKWGRYTFLGYDPKMEITCMNGEMNAGGVRFRTDDPSGYLRQILADHKSPRFEYLPSFTGGLVGYFSYDYLGYPLQTAAICAVSTVCQRKVYPGVI